jgi:hypothetical protein
MREQDGSDERAIWKVRESEKTLYFMLGINIYFLNFKVIFVVQIRSKWSFEPDKPISIFYLDLTF